ncbi:MAG: aminotransferase class I/II-fold pyridoxal phosphate-dependent enzyme [Desulfobulbia bacterium]
MRKAVRKSQRRRLHKLVSAGLELLDSPEGIKILEHLRAMTKRFTVGLDAHGYETIAGDHPVVPLMVRDTRKTLELVQLLMDRGVLVTGLNFPVVSQGDEEIRFQINADHQESEIDYVLEVLGEFANRCTTITRG